MTIAVRISACGSGLAAPAGSVSMPAGMIGGTSRVSLPAVNSSRLTALPRMAMPSSMRMLWRVVLEYHGDVAIARRHFVDHAVAGQQNIRFNRRPDQIAPGKIDIHAIDSSIQPDGRFRPGVDIGGNDGSGTRLGGSDGDQP